MKIGIFSECYLPTLNGVVVSIETFRQEMEKRGHEYFIFAPETKDFVDKDKKHVFRYPSFTWPGQENYPIAFPLLSKKITSKIKDLKLDIIHAQHLFTMGRLGMKVARDLDIPIVYTYHTLIAEYTHYVPIFGGLAKDVIINISKNYCNKCDQIITPSPSMAKILKTYGVKTPIESIPTGIHIEEMKNHFPAKLLRAKWNIPENRKILLYLSRVAKEKNIDFLLKAMKKVLENRREKHGKPDAHLLIVGGGPELNFYKNLVKKMGIENYVTFTDMMQKENANRCFGAADIFVFSSVTETQGIVITEAMAAGVPVVAINKMGPSDLVKNGQDGYLTDLNISDFADKIEKLLDNDSLRQEMGKNAQKSAQEFSSLACAIKMEKLYNTVIQNYKTKKNI
jgi:glycosyltransferase involved in cell wall biosynthesis